RSTPWSCKSRARSRFTRCSASTPPTGPWWSSAFPTACGWPSRAAGSCTSLARSSSCSRPAWRRCPREGSFTSYAQRIVKWASGQFQLGGAEGREGVERGWAQSRTTGEAFDVEYGVGLGDGCERTIWTHGVLTQTQDGLPRWVGVNIDVTERVQAKEELRRQ